MAKKSYDDSQLKDLPLQMMETDFGCEQVYRTSLTGALNGALRNEWEGYLEETFNHRNVVRTACELLNIDADESMPSRAVVKPIGKSLVKAKELAKQGGSPAAAELVACECGVHAETKNHENWELLGKVAEVATGNTAKVLKEAHEKVEKDEDHHLYHSKDWCRELWIQSLGMPAILSPPEEVKQVETAIAASRAKQQRNSKL